MVTPLPDGECWCGCGAQTGLGKYFKPGHDRFAEAALVKMRYGGVTGLLIAHGFGPGQENLSEAWGRWRDSSDDDQDAFGEAAAQR